MKFILLNPLEIEIYLLDSLNAALNTFSILCRIINVGRGKSNLGNIDQASHFDTTTTETLKKQHFTKTVMAVASKIVTEL